jgi:nucleoside 2-deoxyribosyltransferase
MKKKLYIGCSLTQAPEEFKNAIEKLKNELRKDYEILDFVGLVNGTPKDVFEHDTYCVKSCDLFIADCTYPAIGLGYELGVAIMLDKPILAIAHKDAKVTRLVLGVTNPNYSFYRYDKLSEVVPLIKKIIVNIK